MRPIYSVKRDLLLCQKRPITASKETYYNVKRDLFKSEPPCVRTGGPHGQTERGGIVLAVSSHSILYICAAALCCTGRVGGLGFGV